jgi:hypothetical protein
MPEAEKHSAYRFSVYFNREFRQERDALSPVKLAS